MLPTLGISWFLQIFVFHVSSANTFAFVFWHCWLSGRKSIQSMKNWMMRYRRGYLTRARCKWLAHTTATPSASVKSRMVYPSGTGLSRLSWKKRPLNKCLSVVVSTANTYKWSVKLTVSHNYLGSGGVNSDNGFVGIADSIATSCWQRPWQRAESKHWRIGQHAVVGGMDISWHDSHITFIVNVIWNTPTSHQLSAFDSVSK